MNVEQRELEEMLYGAVPEAMPAWPCAVCGVNLGEHTQEMIEKCSSTCEKQNFDRHAA